MITVRKSDERGHFNHGWLDTYHTFSFGDYRDPAHTRFQTLRVINEDVVAPGAGFGKHPHRDMEIVTVMLSGALRHEDSLGNGSMIRAGETQRMTAGSGILHSEFNASDSEPAHLLQIWLFPREKNLTPGYEQKAFELGGKGEALIASPGGRDGSLTIHQDVDLYRVRLESGDEWKLSSLKSGNAWVQVIDGELSANRVAVTKGDGVRIESETALTLAATSAADVLVFSFL